MRSSMLVAALVTAACGGGGDAVPHATTASGAMPTLVATPRTPDDLVVATVDGRPVYGSCVAAQARHRIERGETMRDEATRDEATRDEAALRRAALAECIGFELMAGAAAARQLADDPEVREATREAAVDRLVARDVEARLDAPDTVKPLLDQQTARIPPQLDVQEARESTFLRVEVPQGAPPDAWDRAKQLADQIYAELDGETGLLPPHLNALANRHQGRGAKVTVASFPAKPRPNIVPAYADALFAIAEVGRVAPPTRTQWGYDLILLTRIVPAKRYTREDYAQELLPEARRQYFRRWVDQIVRQYGAIEIDEAQLAQTEGL